MCTQDEPELTDAFILFEWNTLGAVTSINAFVFSPSNCKVTE